jgi:fructose-1,6-bisphosphatase/inositol monophosphatase family enzyme
VTAGPTTAEAVLEALHQVATEVHRALQPLTDWGHAGGHEGQYRHDVVADDVALQLLEGYGFGILSEESGVHHPERDVLVVIDPVDGSTNASRGIPWWATSLCALDADGPLAAVVANQASGRRYEAQRGGGARADGRPIAPSRCQLMSEAIVAVSGYPTRYLGWSQYRSLGAAALDLCAVADGTLDGFLDCAGHSLAPWDYLGALLVCQEAGVLVEDAYGRDLVVRQFGPRRTPIAGATPQLQAQLVEGRRLLG